MNVLKRVKDSASFYYNCPKKSSTTIFSETLRYDSPTRGTAARYAGGLSEVMTLQGSTRNTYGFTYDAAGRLTTTKRFTGTSGTSSSAAYTERGITYNRNGALLTLQRYGSSTSTPQDNYTYTYSGPLLTGVSGKDGGSNITASFTHDANGNTTADGRAGLSFSYNILNLPETVTSGNTQTATYHWLADGTKYKVTDPAGNGVIYAGDLTYMATVSGGNTTYALESAEASVDGTARFLKNGTAMTPYYTIRDHIGSARTIVNASGTVVERNDYYPFGSRTTFGASYATLASNRQKFSGKEDQTAVAGSTLPYLDFGARMYDSKLVRWSTYDPMAEKYYRINPYAYCNGDPVSFVDPSGMEGIKYVDEEGVKTIESNVVVLLQKKIPIPDDASDRKKRRIARRNEYIDDQNVESIDNAEKELNAFYNGVEGGSYNSSGELVHFVFRVIGLESENKTKHSVNGRNISIQYGLDAKDNYGEDVVARATIVCEDFLSMKYGEHQSLFISILPNAPYGTLSHEVGHSLGLHDNQDSGGLMTNPPSRLTTSEVDIIWDKAKNKR